MSLVVMGTSPQVFRYIGDHTHSTAELILNLSGHGVTSINGQEYPFGPGTIQIIPPNTPHCKRADEGFSDVYFQSDDLMDGDMFTSHKVLSFSDDAEKTVEKLMLLMLSRYLPGQKSDPILELMYRLVLELVREQCSNLRLDPAVEQVESLLKHSFNDPELDISEVLCSTGYSEDHIRRRFRAQMHMTPNEYLKGLRIEYAKQLLRREGRLRLSVSAVGEMCGYYDSRYFSRVFKSSLGETPRAYAQRYRRNENI